MPLAGDEAEVVLSGARASPTRPCRREVVHEVARTVDLATAG
jgi:hypothetical protein